MTAEFKQDLLKKGFAGPVTLLSRDEILQLRRNLEDLIQCRRAAEKVYSAVLPVAGDGNPGGIDLDGNYDSRATSGATISFSIDIHDITDDQPPQVNCAAPDGLWHDDNVSILCTASDRGTGLENSNDASFTLTTVSKAEQKLTTHPPTHVRFVMLPEIASPRALSLVI